MVCQGGRKAQINQLSYRSTPSPTYLPTYQTRQVRQERLTAIQRETNPSKNTFLAHIVIKKARCLSGAGIIINKLWNCTCRIFFRKLWNSWVRSYKFLSLSFWSFLLGWKSQNSQSECSKPAYRNFTSKYYFLFRTGQDNKMPACEIIFSYVTEF